MYCEHFGLKEPPFRITPDTRLFYTGGNRGAILTAMVYAVARGEGIIKVVGEVGTGKTMLCRMLEVSLPGNGFPRASERQPASGVARAAGAPGDQARRRPAGGDIH